MSLDVSELAESIREDRSKANVSRWIEEIIKNPDGMPEIIPLLDEEPAFAFRIGWLLDTLVTIKPELVKPFVPELYAKRDQMVFPGYKRSLAKIISHCGAPEELEGEITELFFTWLLDAKTEVAVKVHAMQSMFNLCQKYPDLKHELKEVIEDQMDKNTVAFRARAKKLMVKLQ